MKTALLCELIITKKLFASMIIPYLIIGIVIGGGMQSLVAITACIAAMSPIVIAFSLAGYDNMNGWERFRACLPVSRQSIVAGRYVNILITGLVSAIAGVLVAVVIGFIAPHLPLPADFIANLTEGMTISILASGAFAGTSIILIVVALVMPFVMKYGLTKATRFAPLLLCLLVPLFAFALPTLEKMPAFASVIAFFNNPANMPAIVAISCIIVLAIYALSCFISMCLYRTKEL